MHVPIAAGETNQETGVWIPPADPVPAIITGDIQDLTYRDLQRLPEGEYTIGDRRIFTAAALCEGDILQITEDDATVSEWTVKTMEKSTHLLQKFGMSPRKSYLLKRRG